MDSNVTGIRNLVVGPDKGKDFRDTMVLQGITKKSNVANASNETKEYETGVTKKGPLGGENTNS
jgi:hypothetical protein